MKWQSGLRLSKHEEIPLKYQRIIYEIGTLLKGSNALNVKSIRRENARALAKSVGGIGKFALKLNKAQSQISHLMGASSIKNIGDKIAAQIEAVFDKPPVWLDKEHYSIEETPAVYQTNRGQSAVLSLQVPLLTWEEAKEWNHWLIPTNQSTLNNDSLQRHRKSAHWLSHYAYGTIAWNHPVGKFSRRGFNHCRSRSRGNPWIVCRTQYQPNDRSHTQTIGSPEINAISNL